MSYWTEMVIGGFKQKAILDTGSFDTVVESTDCLTCNGANYNSKFSKTFSRGTHERSDGEKQFSRLGDGIKAKKTGFKPLDNWAQNAGSLVKQVGRLADGNLEVAR